MDGKELRRRRDNLKLTLEELGHVLTRHWNTLSRQERGCMGIKEPGWYDVQLRRLERKQKTAKWEEYRAKLREEIAAKKSLAS